jgi:hypothetical protein
MQYLYLPCLVYPLTVLVFTFLVWPATGDAARNLAVAIGAIAYHLCIVVAYLLWKFSYGQ